MTRYLSSTWYHPQLVRRPSSTHGHGLFATDLIQAGETVMVWGGDLYTPEELKTLKLEGHWSYSIIDEELYMFALANEDDYFINHSCDPNLWMADEVTLIARRTIQPGEEICGDYAVWEADPASRIEPCQCGAADCRTVITGNDWMRPELQERYAGHFMPFLNRRIAASGHEASESVNQPQA